MKVAAIQTLSTPDVSRNLAAAAALVAQAAHQGAELVVLPEYFCLMGQHDRDKLGIAEDDGHGPIQQTMAALARQHGVWLAAGTLPIKAQTDPQAPVTHVRNACCVYSPEGHREARYDKIHLFRFATERESYDEGRVLEAGTVPVSFTLPSKSDGALRVGLSICYDLRFPELYRQLSPSHAPCDVLLVPAAFTHTTGQAHWELLLRTRAVENQCFVIASAQGGLHENGRRTFGHSMVIDPWGQVLAMRADDGEGVVMAQLDLARLSTVRQQLPALTHRVM
jgi:deaminated glutathione amidase